MLAQLRERVRLADEVALLAEKVSRGDVTVQQNLAIKGQQWFRGARELLVQNSFSGLPEFDEMLPTPPSKRHPVPSTPPFPERPRNIFFRSRHGGEFRGVQELVYEGPLTHNGSGARGSFPGIARQNGVEP
jgi:hypothetical protein